MDVILKEDVEDLGQKGEIVHTAPGYARNYLIPRDLAVAATAGNLKNLEHFMVSAEKKRDKEREEVRALADKISALDIKIEARAGDSNRLFGAVTSQDIADFVNAALELSIDKKKIKTLGSIKTLGKHKAVITVYPGLTVEKDIDVVAATGEAAKAPVEEAPAEIASAEIAASEETDLLAMTERPDDGTTRLEEDVVVEVVEESVEVVEEVPVEETPEEA